jgi:hypothetical protein
MRFFDLLTRKKDTHPTALGGLATLAIFGILAFSFNVLWTSPMATIETITESSALNQTKVVTEDPVEVLSFTTEVKHDSVKRDPYDNTTEHLLGQNNFVGSVYWWAWDNNWSLDQVAQGFWSYTEFGYTWIDYWTYCSHSEFPVTDWDAAYWQWVDYSACPTDPNKYKLHGDIYSSSFEFIEYWAEE